MIQSNTLPNLGESTLSSQTLSEAYTQARKTFIVSKGIKIPLHSIQDEKGNPSSPYPNNLTLDLRVGDTIDFGHKNYHGIINGTAITVNGEREVWIGYEELKEIFVLKLNSKDETKTIIQSYINSEQGINEIKKQEEKEREINEKINLLNNGIEELEKLNEKDVELLLDWIYYFQDLINEANNRDRKHYIYDEFIKKGFKSNINIGSEFNIEDMQNFSMYIIGQFIEGLKKPSVELSYHIKKYILEWKSKFGLQTQLDNKKIEDLRKNLGLKD